MKKLGLSAFVVITFLLYSYHTRQEASKVSVRPVATSSNPAPASSPTASPSSSSSGSPATPPATPPAGAFKDGSYTGSVANAYYGNIQVKAVIQGGKLTDVQFLQYPNDRPNSVSINQQAMPYLRQEAIQAQSAQVDVVSGATDTSEAFVESLGAALASAKS